MYFENNEFYKDLFARRDFVKYYSDELPEFEYKDVIDDPGRKYRQNMYGFRCGPFNEKADYLFAGCSVTYGSGIAEESIWGNILSKRIKKNTFPIAMRGVSASWIVDQLLIFFKKYGNPPMVLCLFPDLYRINIPVDGNFYRNRDQKTNQLMEKTSYFAHIHPEPPKAEIYNTYLKMPDDYDKAISPYIAVYENVKSIRHLEQYCNSSGIKLLWSTWHEDFSLNAKLFEKIEELKFDNYFDMKDYGFIHSAKLLDNYRKNIFFNSVEEMKACRGAHINKECLCYLDCHSEFKESMGEEFDYGTDNKDRLSASHPGAHFHLHCCDAFEKKMKELGWI